MQTAVPMSLASESARVSDAAKCAADRPAQEVQSRDPRRDPRSVDASSQRPQVRLRYTPGTRQRRSECQIRSAILGNHQAIQNLLRRLIHLPSPREFASRTSRPGYDAAQRLLLQRNCDRELQGHVHVEPQRMRYGDTEVPMAEFRHFAISPEYQLQGFDDDLLVAAEGFAKRQGALVCAMRGDQLSLLSKHRWVSLGYDPVSIVSPRRLMGQLPPPAEPESPFYADQMPEYYVRIGRLTDLDDMQRLYRDHVSSHFGTNERDEVYWSWLMSRGAHHRIYLFFENEVAQAYVVVRHASVLEIVDATEDSRGAARLLQQVGADAIDQGRYSLRIHSPIDDAVHRWADQADGRLYVGKAEESWMVKVPSYRALLRRLAPEMFRRQRKQKVVTDLSLRIGDEELRITRGVRSMKVTRGVACQHRVGLTPQAAAQLLLGYRSADQLADEKRLVCSTDEVMRTIRVLLPALNLWRTEWDGVSVLSD